MDNLFRMQDVATRRRDRINSDEEERFRLGYELKSGVRFAQRGGAVSVRQAEVSSADGELLATLAYGHAATLWRMNLGWRRRKDKDQTGYVLDIERGYWARILVEDPTALPAVARLALEIAHFDPDTGADEHRAKGAREDCEAACYDCLLSYFDQRDHRFLDVTTTTQPPRELAKEPWLRLTLDGAPAERRLLRRDL